MNAMMMFIVLSLNALVYAYSFIHLESTETHQVAVFESVILISVYVSLLIQFYLLLNIFYRQIASIFSKAQFWAGVFLAIALVSLISLFSFEYIVQAVLASLVILFISSVSYLYRSTDKIKLAVLAAICILLTAVPSYFLPSLQIAALSYTSLAMLLSFSILIWLCRDHQQVQSELINRTGHQLAEMTAQKFSIQNQLSAEHEAYQQLELEMQSRAFELEVTLRELQEKNHKLEQINTQDSLTGVKNRRYFDERVFAEFRRSRREQSPLSLIMLDIDKFKSVNDNYGHLVGDQVIRQTARQIQQQVRRVADCICRFGGEEFAIILPATELEGAHTFAEQIRACIDQEKITTSDVSIKVTVSLGVASIYANDKNTVDELIEQADKALYQAKRLGRNRTVCAKPNFIRAIHSNRSL